MEFTIRKQTDFCLIVCRIMQRNPDVIIVEANGVQWRKYIGLASAKGVKYVYKLGVLARFTQ